MSGKRNTNKNELRFDVKKNSKLSYKLYNTSIHRNNNAIRT